MNEGGLHPCHSFIGTGGGGGGKAHEFAGSGEVSEGVWKGGWMANCAREMMAQSPSHIAEERNRKTPMMQRVLQEQRVALPDGDLGNVH